MDRTIVVDGDVDVGTRRLTRTIRMKKYQTVCDFLKEFAERHRARGDAADNSEEILTPAQKKNGFFVSEPMVPHRVAKGQRSCLIGQLPIEAVLVLFSEPHFIIAKCLRNNF